MAKHSDFILTPVSEILEEAGVAIGNQKSGIEKYPLKEYFLQSLFLKLTGAQEQKFKCILWDIGTYDYEIRYKFFRSRGENVGECSGLKAKNTIFMSIMDRMKNLNSPVKPDNAIRKACLANVRTHLERFHKSCLSQGWPQGDYDEYLAVFGKMNPSNIYKDSVLLAGGKPQSWANIYDIAVFRHRNRCAHNLLSYQGNKPGFALLQTEYRYWNYYLRYALLLLIDEVMSDVYRQWLDKMEGGLYDE